jgi:hypothetical protein
MIVLRRTVGGLAATAAASSILLGSGCGGVDQDRCLDRGHAWDDVAHRCVPDGDVAGLNICRGSGGRWDYDHHSCRRKRRGGHVGNLRYLALANAVCKHWGRRLGNAEAADRYHALLSTAFATLQRIEPPPRDATAIRALLDAKYDALNGIPDDVRLALRTSIRKERSFSVRRLGAANRSLANYGLTACADLPV